MSQKILFLAHVSEAGSTLPKAAYEVLGAALKLSGQMSASLTIGLIGANVDAAAETIAAAGAERILAVAGPDFATARYASDAAAAEALCRASGAELILAPATSRFMRVLAGVAHRLNACVDTHVSSLELLNSELCATRWFYRQRIEGVIRRDARPWIVLLESGCSSAWTGAPAEARVEQVPVTLPEGVEENEVIGIRAPKSDAQTIRPDARSAIRCWRRLDQEAGGRQATCRSSRNSDSRFPSQLRCVVGRQQVSGRSVGRKPGRAGIHDSSEPGWPNGIDTAPSQGVVDVLSRGRTARRWLEIHQRASRREPRSQLRMGARQS